MSTVEPFPAYRAVLEQLRPGAVNTEYGSTLYWGSRHEQVCCYDKTLGLGGRGVQLQHHLMRFEVRLKSHRKVMARVEQNDQQMVALKALERLDALDGIVTRREDKHPPRE